MTANIQKKNLFSYLCQQIKSFITKIMMLGLKTLLLFGLGGQEILLIALIVLLLFGGAKIPELMRGMGKGVKSFKEGMKEVDEVKKDIEDEVKKDEK